MIPKQAKFEMAHPGRMAELRRNWRLSHLDKAHAARHRYHERVKTEFLAAYGYVCAGWSGGLCPHAEGDPTVLTLAHRFNNGAAHRKAVGGGDSALFDLRRRGWPKNEGIAIQCANCQLRDVRRNT
jgi:hypothetical protein